MNGFWQRRLHQNLLSERVVKVVPKAEDAPNRADDQKPSNNSYRKWTPQLILPSTKPELCVGKIAGWGQVCLNMKGTGPMSAFLSV